MPATDVTLPKSKRRVLARRIADMLSLLSPLVRSKDAAPPLRIAVLLQWGIGDAVLALPVIAGLRQAYPKASIELVGKPWLPDLFSGDERIGAFHALVPPWTRYSGKYRFWRREWRDFLRQLWSMRGERFDMVVAPRFDVRDAFQLRFLAPKESVGFGAAGGRAWITRDFAMDFDAHNAMHRAEVSVAMVARLTGQNVSPKQSLATADRDLAQVRARLEAAGYRDGPLLVVHGGAGHPVRRWGAARFSSVLVALPAGAAFVVVIREPSDPAGGDIALPPHLSGMTWSGDLSALKALLRCADLLLCVDSGVMHMAAASDCRTVALFGPAKIEWFGPYGEGHRVVRIEPMPCRPCFDDCIYDKPRCMEEITSQKVLTALTAELESLSAAQEPS